MNWRFSLSVLVSTVPVGRLSEQESIMKNKLGYGKWQVLVFEFKNLWSVEREQPRAAK